MRKCKRLEIGNHFLQAEVSLLIENNENLLNINKDLKESANSFWERIKEQDAEIAELKTKIFELEEIANI